MFNEYKGLVVIIPTRHRAKLAINAIRSVLNQHDCENINVLISDNSTELSEIKFLSEFCEQNQDVRLRYLKTPEMMPMTIHWEWIINQALTLYESNHFLYLTDRMIFRQGSLKEVTQLAKHLPDQVISYSHDKINDIQKPIILENNQWTGKLIELNSEHLLYLNSQFVLFHSCFPRMLNSIAPRHLLETLKKRHGNIFSSISPDFCFYYRTLEVIDKFIYFDKPIIIHYALNKSNGNSFIRGIKSKDNTDFINNIPYQLKLNQFAPIPELRTINNAIINEYYFVKKETKSHKFPEIDRDRYLGLMALDISHIEDAATKAEMLKILIDNGWNRISKIRKFIKALSIHKIFNKISIRFFRKKENVNTALMFDTLEDVFKYVNDSCPNKTSETKHLNYLIGSSGKIVDFSFDP